MAGLPENVSPEALMEVLGKAQVATGEDTYPDYMCSVKFRWLRVGPVVLDERGWLKFPRLPNRPGIYRFTTIAPSAGRPDVYVGEAASFAQRFQRYRTPGRGSSTNSRVGDELQAALDSGAEVVLDIVTTAHVIDHDGTDHRLDLTWKSARRLVEAAVEVGLRRNPFVRVMNLD